LELCIGYYVIWVLYNYLKVVSQHVCETN